MQVILGAGGAIGIELAKELVNYSGKVRLVGRNPKKINDKDELFVADLLDAEQVMKAVEGADIAYLVVGLPYKTRTWQKQWPMIMKNVIDACKQNKTKLVFFDNIYMYNPDGLAKMTEETQILPSSNKGKVRAEIAQLVLDEVKKGELEALIARAADFYGPGIQNSVLNGVVFKNLKSGKKANWFCSTKFNHSFTYTPDAAKATALLGNTDTAYGKVWHLPTAAPQTGEKWIEEIANGLGVAPKTMVIPKFMVQVIGLFNPILREFVEMLYQFDRDYNFDSSKFETIFNIHPTPIKEAIKSIADAN